MTSAAVERRAWLFGPLPDLLFGCGLVYPLMVGIVAAVGFSREAVAAWVPLLILCTSIPHYGATLLRVYATAEARRRYSNYGLVFGLVVWGAFALSLGTPDLGRWFITLYLTWSPWHYSAQNFGLSLMFLQRGGVAVDAPLRRLIKLSYVLSFVVILAGIHGATFTSGSDPLYSGQGGYEFASLEVPDALIRPLLALATLAYVGVTAVMLLRLQRRSSLRTLTPVLGLVASQLVWFIVPVLLGRSFPGLYGQKGLTALAFVWVAIAHAVQYLWISVYYARASGLAAATASATLGYIGAATLVGAALWVVPAWLLAPGVFGVLAFDAGLGLLVASAVNLHHFLLDGVIWKLRDARVGAALVAKPVPEPAPALGLRTNVSWPLRAGIAAVGALAVAFWSIGTWEREVGYRQALLHDDVERLELASRRLALVGRDGPEIHEDLGRKRAQRGERAKALEEYRKSQALAPMPDAWPGMGVLYTRAWNAIRERFN
ncbi:MAG: hypothetical protein WEF50_16405 [Myxococcota bacterium]